MTGVGSHVEEEPIVALATPEGAGGIAIIRTSGRGCWNAIRKLAREPVLLAARTPVWAQLHFDSTRASMPVLCLPFTPGASYTGEESVELFVPSAPPLLRALLEALRRAGIRSAQPGEFTRRAFLNGRIDLTRAESVAQLIAAEDLENAVIVRRALDGELARSIRAIGESLHDLISLLEAGLDFSEQEVEGPDPAWFDAEVAAIANAVDSLLALPAGTVRESPRVRFLIWGRANAGKSTLFNRLAGRELAITSPIAGTTRDPVSVRLSFSGLPQVELIDLAGEMRAGTGPDAGAARLARALVDEGDTILYLLDGASETEELAAEWCELPQSTKERAWPVLNKCDLRVAKAPLRIPGLLLCSAVSGSGVDELRRRIETHLRGGAFASRGERYLFTDRQIGKLRECSAELARLRDSLSGDCALRSELLVIDLVRAHGCLEEITGEIATEETLDRIFRRFCLGK